MKFQKTLLAASLAVVAVSTANAAVVKQVANPVQVTENLVNDKYVHSDYGFDQWFVDANGVQTQVGYIGLSNAPVHSELASTYNNNIGYNDRTTYDYLPVLKDLTNGANELVGIDLGSQAIGSTNNDDKYKYDVFKYTNKDGTVVYRLQEVASQAYVPGTFTQTTDAQGNVKLVASSAIAATDLENKAIWSLERGGQLEGTNFTNSTGYESKVVNGEHVLYGYQGQSGKISGAADGNIVTPNANNQYVTADFGSVQGDVTNDIRYVQSGIIANTGDYINGKTDANGNIIDGYLDPSKNIYGVSVRDNANVVMMTGNGIALADLNNGILQTDGSVLTNRRSGETSISQKARSYVDNSTGKTLVEVYNDVPGADFSTQWYEVDANKQLVAYSGPTPTVGTHVKTGTANFTTGQVHNALVHNTVTNQNVTYKESVITTKEDRIDASVTTNTDSTTDKFDKQNSVELVSETTQHVSTGVIGKNGSENVYGTEVVKTVTKDGATTTAKTTITADYVDSGDFRINGVSIVDNIKESVDGAVAGASEAIDAKVAEVDQKIVEVDSRLTQFNTQAGQINSRVDQLNKRVDKVEKTAYRGTAIALAAQQAIPNIGAGQTAVFGGVGHYESESAFAFGLATVLKDGRTSVSGALGLAGGSEIGGRVGVAYVFGGK